MPVQPLNKQPSVQAGFTMIELMISTLVITMVMGTVTTVLISAKGFYMDQRTLLETQNNAMTALDNTVRLIRMAGSNPENIAGLVALDPDPDNDNVFDSIRVQSDWNPADGALDDPYEDVEFATLSGLMTIKEPTDSIGVPFLEGINAIAFSYLDATGAAISDPETNVGDIAVVRVTVTAQTVGNDTMTFDSAAAVRIRLN